MDDVQLTLLCYVILGSFESTITKLYFQLVGDDPIFNSFSCFLGHTILLPLYFLLRAKATSDNGVVENDKKSREKQHENTQQGFVRENTESTEDLGYEMENDDDSDMERGGDGSYSEASSSLTWPTHNDSELTLSSKDLPKLARLPSKPDVFFDNNSGSSSTLSLVERMTSRSEQGDVESRRLSWVLQANSELKLSGKNLPKMERMPSMPHLYFENNLATSSTIKEETEKSQEEPDDVSIEIEKLAVAPVTSSSEGSPEPPGDGSDPLNLRASFHRLRASRSLRKQQDRHTGEDPLSFRARFQRTAVISRKSMRESFLENAVKEIQWRPTLFSFGEDYHNDDDELVASLRSIGISIAEEEDAHWSNRIPKYLRPLLTSFFRLLNYIVFSLGFLYLPAAVADVSMQGIELLSILIFQRWVRKQPMVWTRWVGVTLTLAALALVMVAGIGDDSSSNILLGFLCVLLRGLLSVCMDVSGEIFMKRTKFAPFEIMGLEGLYAVLMVLPIYALVGPSLGHSMVESFRDCGQSFVTIAIAIAVPVVNLGILSCGTLLLVRGDMVTRKLVLGFRGVLVWLIGITLFHSFPGQALGTASSVWGTSLTLGSFVLLTTGFYVYSSERRAIASAAKPSDMVC